MPSPGSLGPVERISVYPSSRGITQWGSERSWEASTSGATFVRREIARKDAKPALYAGRYAETWLLLVHAPQSSSGFDITPEVLATRYHSPYDRVLLLRLSPYSVHSLEVQKRGSDASAI